MITQGTISYLFDHKPIPMRVRINEVVGYYYQEEKEMVWNECEIDDGERKINIYIEYHFKFNSQQVKQLKPIMGITQFKRVNEKVIVENFNIEKFNELQINLEEYILNQEINYVQLSEIDQELIRNDNYNVKAQVISVDLREAKNGCPYYKVELIQHLTQHEYILMIFQNRVIGFHTFNLQEGQDYIFYNIALEQYQLDNSSNSIVSQKESRLYAQSNTQICHINQEIKFYDFNFINYNNKSKYCNVFGYALNIKASKNKDSQFQILTFISIQKEKVYVIIPNLFFQLTPNLIQKDKIYGFKNVKIVKYSYRYVLLFNGQSSLLMNVNVLPQKEFSRQDFLQYTKFQYQLQCISFKELQSGFIDKECYYVQAQIKSIKKELCQNADQVILIVVFNNTENSEIVVRVDTHKYIVSILSLSEYIIDTSAKAFNLLTNRMLEMIFKNAYGEYFDFIIQAFISEVKNENQCSFRMVKIYQKNTNNKKIKQE